MAGADDRYIVGGDNGENTRKEDGNLSARRHAPDETSALRRSFVPPSTRVNVINAPDASAGPTMLAVDQVRRSGAHAFRRPEHPNLI